MPDSNFPDAGLKEALRKAHAAEAARFEAVLDIRDAQTLRLQALKDDLAPVIAAVPEARSMFDLIIMPGDPPRLWVDIVSSVIMQPDPRTYRLVQDTPGGRELLFETTDRVEMADKVKQHMAHRMIARERQLRAPAAGFDRIGYSTGAIVLAWISGFSVGILALVVIATILKNTDWLPVTF